MDNLLTLKDFEDAEEERDDRSPSEKYHAYLSETVCAVKGHIQPKAWERGLLEENGIGYVRCERCMCVMAEWLPKGRLVAWGAFNIEAMIIVMSQSNEIMANMKWWPGNG